MTGSGGLSTSPPRAAPSGRSGAHVQTVRGLGWAALRSDRRAYAGRLVYAAFDLDGGDLRGLRLTRRKRHLESVLPYGHPQVFRSMMVEEYGLALFEAVKRLDLEGVVAKRKADPSGPAEVGSSTLPRPIGLNALPRAPGAGFFASACSRACGRRVRRQESGVFPAELLHQ
jgi:hypothetical protein